MLTEAKAHTSPTDFSALQTYVGFHLEDRGVASGSVGDHILSSIMYDWMHIYVVSLHTTLQPTCSSSVSQLLTVSYISFYIMHRGPVLCTRKLGFF